jgi:hypothetical protein
VNAPSTTTERESYICLRDGCENVVIVGKGKRVKFGIKDAVVFVVCQRIAEQLGRLEALLDPSLVHD